MKASSTRSLCTNALKRSWNCEVYLHWGVSLVHIIGIHEAVTMKKNLPDLCIAPSSNSWRPMQGFNAGPCFFVRNQELRAACKAGAGTRCGTRGPNRDSVRHHVSRSGFGGTCAILCRNSMPGPGASLGILATMRDSMRDHVSSYGLWDSVRTARRDPGPNPGPRAPAGSECGTTYLDRDSDAHAAYYAGVPRPRSGS